MTDTKGPSKIVDPADVETVSGSSYPAPYSEPVSAREKKRLGEAVGLTRFGVNLVRMPAGSTSSQRHWHSHEDEFVMVLEGELVLKTDAGEQVLSAGMVAGFPAGNGDGHALINRTDEDALFLEVGDRHPEDVVDYPDIDMQAVPSDDGKYRYVHRDGTPYE
jgi:uncharacterized cupin superfamily protein